MALLIVLRDGHGEEMTYPWEGAKAPAEQIEAAKAHLETLGVLMSWQSWYPHTKQASSLVCAEAQVMVGGVSKTFTMEAEELG